MKRHILGFGIASLTALFVHAASAQEADKATQCERTYPNSTRCAQEVFNEMNRCIQGVDRYGNNETNLDVYNAFKTSCAKTISQAERYYPKHPEMRRIVEQYTNIVARYDQAHRNREAFLASGEQGSGGWLAVAGEGHGNLHAIGRAGSKRLAEYLALKECSLIGQRDRGLDNVSLNRCVDVQSVKLGSNQCIAVMFSRDLSNSNYMQQHIITGARETIEADVQRLCPSCVRPSTGGTLGTQSPLIHCG